MIEKQYQIQIKSPCNARVSQMPVVASGKFCEKCEKTVVDFTQTPPGKIREHLLQSRTKVCGFLQRSQVSPPTSHVTKIVTTAIFTSSLLSCQPTQPSASTSLSTTVSDINHAAIGQAETHPKKNQDTVAITKENQHVIDECLITGEIDIDLINTDDQNAESGVLLSNKIEPKETNEKDTTGSDNIKESTDLP
jgi:hypothetical protein